MAQTDRGSTAARSRSRGPAAWRSRVRGLPGRAWLTFSHLPLLLQLGFAILAVGGSIDLVVHTVPADWFGASASSWETIETVGHLVSFAGMAISSVAILVEGIRRDREVARQERVAPPATAESSEISEVSFPNPRRLSQ